MPKKIPTTLAAIVADPKLLKELETFVKKEFSAENLAFIQVKSWKTENLYKIYFAKASKTQVNLPGAIQKALDELATKKLWDDRRWDDLIKKAKADITNLVQKDTIPRFLNDKVVLASLAKQGYVK